MGLLERASASPRVGRVALDVLQILGWAALVCWLLLTFVVRAYTISGPSMRPTLQSGDRVLVDRFTFRFRPPRRGELVAARVPDGPVLVKRVIGLPGDVISLRAGRLILNGAPLDESAYKLPSFQAFGPVRVPPDHYFLLGDNRNNSRDSRDPSIGVLARQDLIGRIWMRFWPPSRSGRFGAPAFAPPSVTLPGVGRP